MQLVVPDVSRQHIGLIFLNGHAVQEECQEHLVA